MAPRDCTLPLIFLFLIIFCTFNSIPDVEIIIILSLGIVTYFVYEVNILRLYI